MKYITIKSPVKCSFTEKRSEFIGHLCPAETNDEAVAFINSVKEQHRKAKHNVYAYILQNDNITRYSDDGEPQGTAGIPVLDVLRKNGLTDVCCVVTRYFGGILLGGGGLVRAYSHSAALAVESAEILHMYSCSTMKIAIPYDLYGKIAYILPSYEIKQLDIAYANDVALTLNVKSELEKNFCEKIIDVTFGKANIQKISEGFDDFPE
ncbi:MAG: YigZ family protein [Clostridium sp.]|nr:YigZ family protein [Clostridium sp.]MCM1547342.1 YigZ family protein [Ruminococcus sp.]